MDSLFENEDYDEYAAEYCAEIVTRLKKIAEHKNISQGTIATRSGIGQSTISKFFSGKMEVTLTHVVKICKALDIEPSEVFSESHQYLAPQNITYNDDTLIVNPAHPAFKGYMGTFHVYFNSTISSEKVILHGELDFTKSNDQKSCVANMKLYTGKYKNNMEITKNYTGKLVISLSMSSCYCELVAKDIGEMCFFVFDHMFLFNDDLYCRMACAVTTSSGGNRRPTMHRLFLSREKLDVSNTKTPDYRFLYGQLQLNNSEIVISKELYDKVIKDNVDRKDTEMNELIDEFEIGLHEAPYYVIDEGKIRNTQYSMDTKLKLITYLRENSLSQDYNKISTKTDEYTYYYLCSRGDQKG